VSEDNGQDGITERVAAILAADAVGYSRLMADDEKATIAALDRARAVFAEHVAANRGRVVDTAGDSVLSVFETTGGAVRASVAIQEGLATLNEGVPEARQMLFRIGIHLGDIHEKADGTVYGDGVNVAARLEALCEPGEVTISDAVRGSVRDRLDIGFEDLGEHEGKNLSEPVRAYRLLPAGAEPAAVPSAVRKRIPAVAAAVAAVVALAGVAWWQMQAPEGVVEMAEGEPEDPVLAIPTGPSIAVLPFDNLGGDPQQDFFADGLAEDILARLSRFIDLRVISRNSSFQFRGDAIDLREIGQRLDARYVLEGSVRAADGRLKVTAQLIDTADDRHVWAESFERDLDSAAIFDIQDDITEKVVAAIAGSQGVISRQLGAPLANATAESLETYECFLLTQAYQRNPSDESRDRAVRCLRSANEREPTNANIWANLALLYHDMLFGNSALGLEDPLVEAEAAARKALELDAGSHRAHEVLAWISFLNRDVASYQDNKSFVISLNPNNPEMLMEFAWRDCMIGEWDLGLSLVAKAELLNPLSARWAYGICSAWNAYRLKNYDDVAPAVKEWNLPDNHWPQLAQAAACGQAGRTICAEEAVANAKTFYPGIETEIETELQNVFYAQPEFISHVIEGLEKAGLFDEPAPPSRPVIAVLPFDNLSGDPGQEYFADGITEDIITRLAQYPDILVLGRNTTFQFKGEAVDIPTIAEKLGADYVVEGSIRRGGDMVRVTAQLLGGEEWGHVWAETFDRTLDPQNIFAIQDDITKAVANRIGDPYGAISQTEFDQFVRHVPENMSTYDCILRFYEYGRLFNAQTHLTALRCFEDMMKTEQEYGEGLSYVSELYLDDIAHGFGNIPDASLEKALIIAERAAAIDPNSGRTRIRLARALMFNDKPKRALHEVDRALRLDPNNVPGITMAADIFIHTGQFDRAEEIMGRIVELNPNYPPAANWIMAFVHIARREHEDAVKQLEMTQMPWWYWTQAFLASALCSLGDLEAGQTALNTALELNPDLYDVYWPESYFWNKGDDVRPIFNNVAAGLEACGWEMPPDPGRDTTVAPQ
jgi:adenylate cyclase